MIQIDGSLGEGGGQVLRSSLTLSLLTGQPLRIENIRAKRPKPGLRAQHLAAVHAATHIARAQTYGAEMGSTALQFQPGDVHPGRYHFDIGTAGSTSLVLQTIFLPMALAEAPSEISITGGTHVPWSPSFHYLDRQWLPVLRRLGFQASLTLERAGFYPRGGGLIRAVIEPANSLATLDLAHRGTLRRINGLSLSANLPEHITRRQKQQVEHRLKGRVPAVEVESIALSAHSPGTAVHLQAECEHGRAGFTALGKRGKPAELVADEAVEALLAYLNSGAAVDKYMADQLIIPLALVPGPSTVTTSEITLHLLTNIAVVQNILPTEITVEGDLGQPGRLYFHVNST